MCDLDEITINGIVYIKKLSSNPVKEDSKEPHTHLGEWFYDCCILDANSKTSFKEVFSSYSQWCTEHRVSYRDIYSSIEFGRQLLRNPLIKNARPYINGKQVRGYDGIRLTRTNSAF